MRTPRFAVAHLTSRPSSGLTGKSCIGINDRIGETLTEKPERSIQGRPLDVEYRTSNIQHRERPYLKRDSSAMSLVIQGFSGCVDRE
jgi:hypothetical protein